MSDITLSSRTGIRPFRSRAGSPRIVTYPAASTCASTARIVAGQVVQLDATSTSNHKIIRASTAAGHPNLSTNIIGIAAQSDDGTVTDPPLSVWAQDGNTEFIFPTKIAGTGSSLVGTALALGFDSTLAIHYLAANSTAGDLRVWVTDVLNPGDTNGYVVGRFFSTAVAPAVWTR